MSNYLARCSCEKLTVKVDGEPLRVSICHCKACQRRTGSAFGVQARFLRKQVNINGTGKSYSRIGDEGTEITFTFCSNCGSTVYFTDTSNEAQIAIPVGAFSDQNFLKPSISVYEERMHHWVLLPEDIEHMD